MATFDISQQRLCVRIVYDGAASAGKTTNLRQLAELFATQRTGELLSPAEMAGRTLFFDWLQIAAGMVCGIPLLCQVISVPGQQVLTPRRKHLLSTADVVVHVCDSDAEAVERAIEGMAVFAQVERDGGQGIPLVIQANKQDRPGAVPGASVAAKLRRTECPVVEAIAADGIGVMDTFVAAVRAVVRSVQERVDRGDVRVPVRNAQSAGALLTRLSEEVVDPDWELELLLEEASNAMTLGDSLTIDVDGSLEPAPPTWRPPRAGARPPLPIETVPTGFVWPAHTGRVTLRLLAQHAAAAGVPELDEWGRARVLVADRVVTTSLDLRFDDAETARQALVRMAREATKLGPLLDPETVIVAQPSEEGTTWLWTVRPRMPCVQLLLTSPAELDAAARLGAFVTAVVDGLRIEARHGLALSLSPDDFGVGFGPVRYLGDLVPAESRELCAALQSTLSRLAAAGIDVESASMMLAASISSRLSTDERERLSRRAWALHAVSAAPFAAALRRIEEALRNDRRAA